MAVTGIRKISSSVLLALIAISIVVFGLFFLGGSELDEKGNIVYANTGLLLYLIYILIGATILATLCFAVKGAINPPAKATAEAKKSGFFAFGGLLILLVLSFFVADATPLVGLNEESEVFNTPFWLKLTDVWLFTTYGLFLLLVGAVAWGGLKSLGGKK